MPFLADEMWQNSCAASVRREASVHLALPRAVDALDDAAWSRRSSRCGRSSSSAAGPARTPWLRQPLAEVIVATDHRPARQIGSTST
jgi:hypothetical protein